jgi:hypothetical protein
LSDPSLTTGPAANASAPERRACRLLFVVVLALHAWCSHLGWTNLPVDGHEFRQMQTALSVRYLMKDGLRLDYPTPLLGKPWSIPLEFPLYQAAVAVLARATSLPIEQAGRVVGLAFFYLMLPAAYLLLGRLGLAPPRRLLALCLVLASPVYLFYSRTVLIESTALCLSVWFLWGYWTALAQSSRLGGAVALTCGALAAMVKLTTFAVFLPPAALMAAIELWNRRPASGRGWRPLAQMLGAALALGGGPFAAGIAWSHHADSVKALNPLAGLLLSSAQAAWGVGGFSQRFAPGFWATIFSTWTDGVLGLVGQTVLGIFALMPQPQSRWRFVLLLACFLAGPLAFANFYFVHDYYFYESGLFLLVAAGLALDRVLDASLLARPARWAIVLVVIAAGFLTYARTYYTLIPGNATRTSELARALNLVTKADDVIIIYGQDWNPLIPYFSGRRALMFPGRTQDEPAAQETAFGNLTGERVGAMVIAGSTRSRPDFVALLTKRFGLSPRPVLTSETTVVYLREQDLPVVLPILQRLPLTEYQISAPSPSGTRRVLVADLPDSSQAMFAMMAPRPREVYSQYGIGLNTVGNQKVFAAHPVTELVFDPPPGARRLQAGYGLQPEAYAEPNKATDGVQFEIVLRQPDGTSRILAQNLLDPVARAEDRGIKTFDLQLPAGLAGEIILRTGPGPAKNFSYDWAFWSAVSIK